MSGVDIRDLGQEKLSEGKFPVDLKSDFRFCLAEAAHKNIQQHAKADVSVEICGVLVGQWKKDSNGPFAEVTDIIRCDSATSKFAEVTFTHESWSQINKEMDSQHADKRIIGWYHSHPDFGIFLSDRDVFIHENFFSGPGQVAYVVDPVRDLEGVFVWKDGKPEPISHYWIGNQVRTVEASVRSPSGHEGSKSSRPGTSQPAAAPAPESSLLPMLTMVLSFLAVFLLGYLIAGQRSKWERDALRRGVVAHYGLTKVMKPGFEKDMSMIESLLKQLQTEFEKLPAPTEELSDGEKAEAAKRRKLIAYALKNSVLAFEQVKEEYALSAVEQAAVAHLMAQKQAELGGQSLKPLPFSKTTKPSAAQKKTKSPKSAAANDSKTEAPPTREASDSQSPEPSE